MRPITRVEHAAVEPTREQLGCTGRAVHADGRTEAVLRPTDALAMLRHRTLVWIAVGALTLGAGLSVAVVALSTPLAPPVAQGADAVQTALLAGRPTVVEFGANACAACREMKLVLSALRQTEGERITIVDVDLMAQKEADYIRRYRIQLMPTQLFFDAQGRETSRHMGKISAEEILAHLLVPAQPGGPQ